MKVLITQSNYIPWKGFFDSIQCADVYVVYDDMQYTKRDWRNRNRIKTRNGLQWLTIPVKVKGKYEQKINETLISDKNWQKKHWNTIVQNYRQAPCFEHYCQQFEELYLTEESLYLSQVNLRFLKVVCEILDIKTTFRCSSEFTLIGNRSEKLLHICQALGATHYISGPTAKNYLEENIFWENNIEVVWMEYSGYPEYPQLYGNFTHAVSVLDLLFNTGPAARSYLKYGCADSCTVDSQNGRN